MATAESESPRPYDATARRERARIEREATRGRIVAAASAAFLDQGYVRTSVASIAEAAGVSVQTVYLAVGSKADILRLIGRQAVVGTGDADTLPDLSWVARLAAEPDPPAQIGILISESLALVERAYPIWQVFTEAAAHDPALGPDVRENEAGRRRDQRALVGMLHGLAVSPQRAADIVHALLSPEMWRSLALDSGWSHDEIEAFATDLLTHALLGER